MHPVARALALSIGPAVGIGLTRFGYAVLLADLTGTLSSGFALPALVLAASAALAALQGAVGSLGEAAHT